MNTEEIDIEKNALQKAWEIRNFEIKLYWHRAAYFWAFITTMSIAFYHLNKTTSCDYIYKLITGVLGVASSMAWVLSNLASKHWQENWENHIKILEDNFCGRLYKTVISDYKYPSKPSVSRLNLKLSMLVMVAWFVIYFKALKFDICSISILVFVVGFMLIAERVRYKHLFLSLFKNKKYDTWYMQSGHRENVDIDIME